MAIRHQDSISGAALVAAGGVVTWLSLDIGTGAGGATLAPNFFPLLCAGGLMLCGALILLKGLLSAPAPLPAVVDGRLLAVGAAVVAFYWFFEYIDFRFGTWLLAVISLLSFGIASRRLLIVFPVVLSVVLYLTFTYGFSVVLPTWI